MKFIARTYSGYRPPRSGNAILGPPVIENGFDIGNRIRLLVGELRPIVDKILNCIAPLHNILLDEDIGDHSLRWLRKALCSRRLRRISVPRSARRRWSASLLIFGLLLLHGSGTGRGSRRRNGEFTRFGTELIVGGFIACVESNSNGTKILAVCDNILVIAVILVLRLHIINRSGAFLHHSSRERMILPIIEQNINCPNLNICKFGSMSD